MTCVLYIFFPIQHFLIQMSDICASHPTLCFASIDPGNAEYMVLFSQRKNDYNIDIGYVNLTFF